MKSGTMLIGLACLIRGTSSSRLPGMISRLQDGQREMPSVSNLYGLLQNGKPNLTFTRARVTIPAPRAYILFIRKNIIVATFVWKRIELFVASRLEATVNHDGGLTNTDEASTT